MIPMRLTFRACDAGASPRTACVVAAVEVLDDRASAADGGVRSGTSQNSWN